MLYKLHKGSVPNYTGGQDPLVYLVSSAEAVAAAGSSFVFSDGNCASTLSQFATDLIQIESVVDWEVMNATMWANTADDMSDPSCIQGVERRDEADADRRTRQSP
jgi:hypothetical protein